jgi:hypothetical protein
MTKSLLIALTAIILYSCTDIQKHADNKEFVPEWDLFKIKFDDRVFLIPMLEDSIILITQLPDSVTKNFRPNQSTYVSEKIFLSKTEKDTILKLAIKAITKPVLMTQEVSCYGGQNVTLTLDYARGTKLECKYSSVSSWASISPTLMQIYQRTFKKYGR